MQSVINRVFVKDKSFYRLMLTLALPITLQSLINVGVNMADTIMLGKLGETALSASSLANQFCFVFMILNMGLSGGAGVLTSQFWGKGDSEAIGRVLGIVYRLTLCIAAIFFVLAQFFPEMVMRFYTNDMSVVAEGVKYLKVISWAYFVQGLSILSVQVLRTVGMVKLALVTTLVTLANNIFMNWIFIFGNLGAPAMGAAGAALATAISRLLEFTVITVYMLFIDKRIRFKLKNFVQWDMALFRDYVKNGLPVLVSDFLLAMGMSMISVVLGHMSREVVAANAIVSVVWHFVTIFQMGVSSSSMVIIGNTVGAKRYDDAQKYGQTFAAISVMIGTAAGLLLILIKTPIINYYDVAEATKSLAHQMLYTTAFITIFSSLSSTLTKGVLRAGGDTKFLMVADVLFLWLLSVPLGALAGLVLHAPAWLVLLCLKADELVKGLWCVKRLMSKKWVRNVTLGVEMEQTFYEAGE